MNRHYHRFSLSTLKSTLTYLLSACVLLSPILYSPAVFAQSGASFPLDPLSKDEIAAAVNILRSAGKASDSSRFATITLHEPPKSEVLAFKPGDPIRREAFAVVYERSSNKTYEAVVDVKGGSVESWREILGSQPPFLIEDLLLTITIVRADPEWRQAMTRRGITDFQSVQIDAWSAGYYGFPDEENARMVRALSYYRGKYKNPYAHPIEGVVAYVNLNTKKVQKLVDTGVVPVVTSNSDLDESSVGPQRAAPKPLEMVQPEGASFQVNGREIIWQKWHFRYTLHPREGLVLYTVGYEDQGRIRPILYRASLSEMVVPYGDPGPAWFFKNAFDEGEYGVGRLAQPLEPKSDFPSNATTYNAVFASDTGTPYELPRAVALYERDGGILWKHVDYLTGNNQSRRARELVLSYVANVGNYEYGFNWIFHQDGALEMEVDLTGIMQAKGIASGEAAMAGHNPSDYGHVVGDGVEAVHHQHFLNFRLDMDVDGDGGNSVVELNTQAVPPGKSNPHRNAFVTTETQLLTEQQGQRQIDLSTSRKWKVINPSVKNALGQPTGYMLVPGENSVPYADPESSVRKRAGFINSHLWVTQYDASEMNSAGYYINQSKGGEGLPKWVKQNRSIDGKDIVLWYTMGITHIPRPEEWPVMTTHKAGFMLIPAGFFSRNPALDVPKP
jgi:primary-amine oxidase